VWLGSELSGNRDWIIRLSEDARAELEAAAENVRAKGITLDDATRADLELPKLAPVLAATERELSNGRGFFFMRGLPVGDYTADELGAILWGIGTHLGVGVSQSAAGERLGDVIDKGATDRYYTSSGSIEYHMDPVDVVGLLCLKTASEGGASRIASAPAIHNVLLEEYPDKLEILYRGFYNSRRAHGQPPTDHPVPVFAEAGTGVECYLLPMTIRQATEEGFPMNEADLDALETLIDTAARPGIFLDMEFEPGDIQFLNNRLILHARTDYEDDPDPALKRHLLRLWLMMPGWKRRAALQDFYKVTDRAGGGIVRVGAGSA